MMSSKEQTHNRKDSARHQSPQPQIEKVETLEWQKDVATTIQRAKVDPQSLTPREMVQLQRTIGNQATQKVLGGERRAAAPHRRNTPGPTGPRHGRQQVVQRLEVIDTQWSTVTKITASGEGGQGVLFFDDGDKKLVVKPNVHAAEEQIAAFLHQGVSEANPPSHGTEWHLGALGVRIATGADVAGIQAAAARVFSGAPPQRVQSLLNGVAAGSTMIQALAAQAPGEGGTFGGRLADTAATTGHTESHWLKRRIKKSDLLKPLINDPSFTNVMGQAAAIDIFTGNTDRFAGTANFENWMISYHHRAIYLIDNVVDMPQGQFETWTIRQGGGAFSGGAMGGGGAIVELPPSLNAWAAKPLTQKLAQQDYVGISQAVWGKAAAGGLASTLYDELLLGMTSSEAQPFVTPQERETIQKKIDKHLADIVKNFAQGLQQGRQVLLSLNGGFLPPSLPVSQAARRMYRARILVLQGDPPDNAWDRALVEVKAIEAPHRQRGKKIDISLD